MSPCPCYENRPVPPHPWSLLYAGHHVVPGPSCVLVTTFGGGCLGWLGLGSAWGGGCLRGHHTHLQLPPSQLCVSWTLVGCPSPPCGQKWGTLCTLWGSPCTAPLLTAPVCPVPQAPGSAMARARQEGSSPEPVEGLARDGPRPFPLSRLVPSAVSCGLCEPGLPAAPAAPALLPAAYLCAPTAPPAVTAALGAPRWPGGPRSRPRGPRPDGECLPPTRDAGSWGKRDPEEPGKGERVGGGGEPAGPLGGCGQCGLCVARSMKTEWEAGGWGEADWEVPPGIGLQSASCSPLPFPGPGQQLFSSPPPSPVLGPREPLEDCSWKECGQRGLSLSGLRGGVEGGLVPLSASL